MDFKKKILASDALFYLLIAESPLLYNCKYEYEISSHVSRFYLNLTKSFCPRLKKKKMVKFYPTTESRFHYSIP